MYTIVIQDHSGRDIKFRNIIKVSYSDGYKDHFLEKEDIFTHLYPISYNLHLFSDVNAYTIGSENISIIEVQKE